MTSGLSRPPLPIWLRELKKESGGIEPQRACALYWLSKPASVQRTTLSTSRLDNPTGSLTMCPCSTTIEAARSEPTPVVDVDVLTHYCIVRRDLSPGTQAAQLIHAAGESSPGNLPPHTFAVALTCADECELYELAIRLDAAGVKHKVIAEPDEPYNGAFMAIGVFPQPRSRIRRHFSNLPLLK